MVGVNLGGGALALRGPMISGRESFDCRRYARLWASESATSALRQRFPPQPDLQITPIEKIRLPLQSGDELPPLLTGLQWLWTHPPLQTELFALLADERLQQINARIAAAGREVSAKRGGAPVGALAVKVDTCVLETDVHLIQDDDEPVGAADGDQSVPVADRLLGRHGAGSLASLSFDKGFTRAEDREWLNRYVPAVVMPQRGQKNAAETEREREKRFVALRRAYRAVEREINSLEPHGLNRCLDVGRPGDRRCVGYGVRSYNLHGIGRELRARQRARAETMRMAA